MRGIEIKPRRLSRSESDYLEGKCIRLEREIEDLKKKAALDVLEITELKRVVNLRDQALDEIGLAIEGREIDHDSREAG